LAISVTFNVTFNLTFNLTITIACEAPMTHPVCSSTPTDQAGWQALAQRLTIEGRAYVKGDYQWARNGETFACISPIDGRELANVASCDQADADHAVAVARGAFESGVWSRLPPSARKAVLVRFADLIEAHGDELALLDTLDMGKPVAHARAVDVPATARAIRWTAEAIDKVYGELAATPHDQIGMISREPMGVVAAIVPWNFPMIMAAWKIAPALATGNSVILKPSEKSPLTAIRLAVLATEAGIPDGVFNVLPGYGHTVGKALALHMDVDCLVFTGSTNVAKQLMIYAGQSNLKRVWLEAGGKSPNIVFADAPDLKKAAAEAATAIAFNQGEVCTAGSRLLVEDSIRSEFIGLVCEALKTWHPGHPLDPATTCGAIVDQAQLDRIIEYIGIGQSEGARLVAGGKRVMEDTGGLFIQPTVFAGVTNHMRIASEEIFGPVLSVIGFHTAEEAITIANDSIYGLAAAVWTANINTAHKVAKALRAGSVWINHYDGGDMTAPFGGFKQSGNGRDKSLHAFDKYTELKATWLMLE
jgi:acyl-CoA reductase-like NAD-dependent aldehyde dehydrogenase